MNIAIMSVRADGTEVRGYLRAEYNELMPAISQGDRWIAYLSNEDPGGTTIFVRAFEDVTGQVPIPSGVNGTEPVWAPDGSALYHAVGSGRGTPITRVVRVPLLPGATFRTGPAETLFEGTYASGDAAFGGTNWDIHPDGQRFVMITAGEGATPSATAGLDMRLVVNWFEELRAVEGR